MERMEDQGLSDGDPGAPGDFRLKARSNYKGAAATAPFPFYQPLFGYNFGIAPIVFQRVIVDHSGLGILCGGAIDRRSCGLHAVDTPDFASVFPDRSIAGKLRRASSVKDRLPLPGALIEEVALDLTICRYVRRQVGDMKESVSAIYQFI